MIAIVAAVLLPVLGFRWLVRVFGCHESWAVSHRGQVWLGPSRAERVIRLVRQDTWPDLEFRLSRFQAPPLTNQLAIRGTIRANEWLVGEANNGSAVWPSCRSAPVLGTEVVGYRIKSDDDGESLRRQLLYAYAALQDRLGVLPTLIRRPANENRKDWWTFPAFTPLTKWLVTAHIRRRLHQLRAAFLNRAASSPMLDAEERRVLVEAAQECGDQASPLKTLCVRHHHSDPVDCACLLFGRLPITFPGAEAVGDWRSGNRHYLWDSWYRTGSRDYLLALNRLQTCPF